MLFFLYYFLFFQPTPSSTSPSSLRTSPVCAFAELKRAVEVEFSGLNEELKKLDRRHPTFVRVISLTSEERWGLGRMGRTKVNQANRDHHRTVDRSKPGVTIDIINLAQPPKVGRIIISCCLHVFTPLAPPRSMIFRFLFKDQVTEAHAGQPALFLAR